MRYAAILRVRLGSFLALTCVGTAIWAQTSVFSGGTDEKWSTAGNWNLAPGAGGGATTLIQMGKNTPVARAAATIQDLGAGPDIFELNILSFEAAGPAFKIDPTAPAGANGNPLKFSGNAAGIVNDSNVTQTINVPIQLNADLTLSGAMNATGKVSLLKDIKGNKAVTIDTAGAGLWSIENANNTFTGPVVLKKGRLSIGDNVALGTGPFQIQGGTVLAGLAPTAITNPVTISASFQAGETGNDKLMVFNADTTISGVVDINLPNPKAILLLNGAVKATVNDGINVVGAANTIAPKAGKLPRRITAYGGLLRIGSVAGPGNKSPDFQGKITVTSGALLLNGELGQAAVGKEVASVTVRKDAVIGGSGIAAPNLTPGIHLKKGGLISFAKDSYCHPGTRSPGIFTIFDGDMEMEGGSTLRIEIDGPTPGEGDGFHDQLQLAGGSLLLDSTPGDFPILDVDVMGITSYPQVGEQFRIIDVTDSLISRITGDFMAADGQILSQGTVFTDALSFTWQIDYFGGTGNDVVLTSIGVPEPGMGALCVFGGALACMRRRGRVA
jgi:autotransporter-associated beta strand protein